MGHHKFGELSVETKYLGTSPLIQGASIYSVKVSDPSGENWIDRNLTVATKDRTPEVEAGVMVNVLLELLNVADKPEAWGKFARDMESLSPAEIKAVQDIAERLQDHLPIAVEEALEHKGLFDEYREGAHGPLGFKISGKRRRS